MEHNLIDLTLEVGGQMIDNTITKSTKLDTFENLSCGSNLVIWMLWTPMAMQLSIDTDDLRRYFSSEANNEIHVNANGVLMDMYSNVVTRDEEGRMTKP